MINHNANDADDSTPNSLITAGESKTTVRHDWTRELQPSVTIVEAVAAATGRPVTDLPPIQQSIDADALEVLLTHGSSAGVEVTFKYANTTVSVSENGSVEIYLDDSPSDGDGE